MTLIILHCFYHDNEIRGYAQSRPQGLINVRDKVPLSFVLQFMAVSTKDLLSLN